ncbi:MAG: primase C-terminal domain-containing protein [Candidatus Omnitrophica bacterium]|nr:primase C-terminal domain-containing protein [Candidatus Omnitrophota bacterium]
MAKVRTSKEKITQNIQTYLSCGFQENDIIELRFIHKTGKRKVLKKYCSPESLLNSIVGIADSNRQGYNAFIGANPRKAKNRSGDDNVALARWLFVDFDFTDDYDKKVPYNQEMLRHVKTHIKANGVPCPSMMINSGNGIHAYWKVTPEITSEHKFKDLQKRLIATLDTDKAVCNFERIMRLPGFKNHKGDILTSVIEYSPKAVYSLETMEKCLPGNLTPKPSVLMPDKPVSISEQDYVWLLENAESYVNKCKEVNESERNVSVYYIACRLNDFGIKPDDAISLLDKWNENNQPPLSTEELKRTVKNAYKYHKKTFGCNFPSKKLRNDFGISIDQDGIVKLSKQDEDAAAAAFILWTEFNGSKLYRYHPIYDWVIYENGNYKKVNKSDIEADIRKFISGNVLVWQRFYEIEHFEGKRRSVEDYKKAPKAMKTETYIRNVAVWLKDTAPGVKFDESMIAPCGLSSDFQNRKIIAMKNGLLDITDSLNPILLPHSPEYFTFNYLPYDYDPTAKCPTFDLLMGQYFKCKEEDEIAGFLEYADMEAYNNLLCWMKKYVLHDTSSHRMLMLFGETRSGKSTLGRIIQELIGSNNTTSVSMNSLANGFGLEPLLGKCLAIAWDAKLSGRSSDANRITELLKSLSGEDGIIINRKNKPMISVDKLPINILIICNELPYLGDSSGALSGRLNFLKTSGSFFGKEDPSFENKVIAEELPGIFNKVLAASEGVIPEHPKSISIRRNFERLSNPFKGFADDFCIQDSECYIPKDWLYLYYCLWCQDQGRKSKNRQSFKNAFATSSIKTEDYNKRMSKKAYEMTIERYGVKAVTNELRKNCSLENMHLAGDRIRCYKGIDIHPDIKEKYRNAAKGLCF